MSIVKLIGSWIKGPEVSKRRDIQSVFWNVNEVVIKVTSKNGSVVEFKALEEADYTRNRGSLQIMKLAEPLESIIIEAECRETLRAFTLWEGVSVDEMPIVSNLKRKEVDDLSRVKDILEEFISKEETERRYTDCRYDKPITRIDNQGRKYDVRELLDRVNKLLE